MKTIKLIKGFILKIIDLSRNPFRLLAISLVLTSACIFPDNETTSVNKVVILFESNYDPLPPAFARIGFWGGSSNVNGQDMTNIGGQYLFEASITQGNNYIFNIETNNYPVCGNDDNEWVASFRGIRAKEIKVNDKILDNSFLFYNQAKNGANFVFTVNDKGEVVPGTGESITVNDAVPSEIWFDKETIRQPTRSISNLYGNAWFSVVHDTRKSGTSQVEIESLKFWARLANGQDVLLASDDFNNVWGGKLYIRYPYFECSLNPQFMFDMPAQLINGKLVFKPSEVTNRVWHGWCTGSWPRIPSNAVKLWVEAEIKIIGNALVQIGVDLKTTQDGNDGYWEYGLSDWYFQNYDFRKVYFNKQN